MASASSRSFGEGHRESVQDLAHSTQLDWGAYPRPKACPSGLQMSLWEGIHLEWKVSSSLFRFKVLHLIVTRVPFTDSLSPWPSLINSPFYERLTNMSYLNGSCCLQSSCSESLSLGEPLISPKEASLSRINTYTWPLSPHEFLL